MNRILGSILGGAIGDCLGGPYEGRKPPLVFSHQFEWRISDDTQLTLATCESISRTQSVDPQSISETFTAWHRSARFTGLGASTYKALSELCIGGHWALVGRRGERAAGNGAAMRIAPLAFCLDHKDPVARTTIRDVCRITHHHDEAYVGALAIVIAIREGLNDNWQGESGLLPMIIDQVPDSSVRDRLIELTKVNDGVTLIELASQMGASGYVVESVPLALFASQRLKLLGFAKLMEELILAGGDTDTIASITGQITGAIIGQDGLPEEWKSKLPDREMIFGIAGEFASIVLERFNSTSVN
ncbi:MAG: ADP-ribosylglycohydrolase family protein [Blastocatellia bacterium]|nr:ADP-ribosylglycohydrolase family protein [Blastocatellia bacterium]